MVLRVALAALAVAVLAACGDGDDAPTVAAQTPSTTAQAGAATTAGTVLSVTVRGGSVVDGAARQRATVNQPVTIRVTSDVADEVHVHGYEKRFDVAPGRTGEVTFVANIPGIFEVELERSHKLLFSLEVR
jgi:carbonic anhydrase/acetyltransferase-like protein (isoleucine patch superfamily)